MGSSDYYKPGDWNAYCARCGRKRKASELRRQWQGFYVCPTEWEPRQPQDFVRGIVEHPTPPWVQNPEWRFVADFCTPNGMSAMPDYAIPDCAIPDYISPIFDFAVGELVPDITPGAQ